MASSEQASPAKVFKTRCWFFTLNNPTVTAEQIKQFFGGLNARRYVFQLERGEAGTLHFQGCVQFKQVQAAEQLNEFAAGCWQKLHNPKKAFVYCSKTETRVGGPWGLGIPEVIEVFRDLYPWQTTIRDECSKKPCRRTVNWIWDPEGNSGKTEFCRYMFVDHDAVIISAGKAADMKHAVCAALDERPSMKVVLVSLPRDSPTLHFGTVEAIKDGMVFSTKYESNMCVFNPPHLYILSNELPMDFSALTRDRWNVRKIVGRKLEPVDWDQYTTTP